MQTTRSDAQASASLGRRCRRSLAFPVVSLLACLVGIPAAARGQEGGATDPLPVSDSLRALHTLHVSPHLIVFDPHTTSATLEFSNLAAIPTEGEVVVELGYTAWPDNDLAAPVNPHYPNPRDTVIRTPRPADHYAGTWLTGLPTHLLLKPHETRRVTLHLAPPAGLPAGEYSARIVTLVQPPPPRGGGRDTRAMYAIPAQGHALPQPRDSVRVFYRQGPLRLGLEVHDPRTGIGQPPAGQELQLRDDWVRLPVHLTGNVHFEGNVKHYIRNQATGQQAVEMTTRAITLTRDGVIHHWCDVPAAKPLDPGSYTMVWIFEATQDEFSPAQRVPMTPVQIEIPFVIK